MAVRHFVRNNEHALTAAPWLRSPPAMAALFLAFSQSSIASYIISDSVWSPSNLTLEEVTATSAEFHWHLTTAGLSFPTKLKLMVLQLNSTQISKVDDLEVSTTNHTVNDLEPDTEYQVYLVAYDFDGSGNNVSDVVAFRTLSNGTLIRRLVINPGEAVVVLFILTAWICAVIMFLHKWSKLRLLAPREYNYKSQPKNIETIKVVKRPTDSVIYRNYSDNVNKTMAMREKRLQRMSTMPNIKIGLDGKPLCDFKPSHRDKTLERMRTVPLLPLTEEKTNTDSSVV